MSGPLFREEALNAQRQRLHGDVLIASPLSFRLITLLLGSLVVALGAVLVMGSFARTETVPGWLVPTGGLVKLMPARTGVVERVLKQAGEAVAAGEVVAYVISDPVSRAGDRAAVRMIEALRDQRLLLENQMLLEETKLAGKRAALQADKASLLREINALDRQIALQQAITASAETGFRDVQALLEKGFISKAESERRRQAWLQAQRQEEAFAQTRAAMMNRVEQVALDMAALGPNHAQTLADFRARLSDLDQRQAEMEGRESFAVQAPVSGTLTSVSLYAGRAVDASQPVATLLPAGSVLEARLFVPSRAAGFVAAGQQVSLRYAAFPYQRFGAFPGRVEWVSGTIEAPGEVDTPLALEEPFYQVSVSLASDRIEAFGKPYELQPGMLLEANIILERQTFLGWLLEPLRAVTDRG